MKGTTVTSQDNDTATVLVVVSQTYHNRDVGPTTNFHVLELTLIKTGNGWKVDKVGNPSSTSGQ